MATTNSYWPPDMFSRLKKFALLGPGKQLLLLRIWLLLARARLQLLRKGFAHFTANLTLHRTIPTTACITDEQLEQAVELGRLVAIAARYTPWQSRCLTQVLVLQRLLEQRQIPGYFSLGVRKAGSEDEELFNAHAWLQCGDAVVNGAAPKQTYTTLSTFSWG
jgi:hypothetical protein